MIEARIGGDGTTVVRLSATEHGDMVAMIDEYLAEHPNGVLFVEVKRDDTWSWEIWKDDLDHIEFMQVGVFGDHAAPSICAVGPAALAGSSWRPSTRGRASRCRGARVDDRLSDDR